MLVEKLFNSTFDINYSPRIKLHKSHILLYMRCVFRMKLSKSTFTMYVKYNVIGDMTSPCRDE